MALQIYDLLGVIRNVQRLDKGNILSIVSSTTQKEHQVVCPFFCPARKGDVISGLCVPIGPGTNGKLEFVQNPIVDPPATKEAVQTAFIIAMGRGNRMSQFLSDQLYDYFKRDALRKIERLRSQQEIGSSEWAIYKNKDILNSAIVENISYHANVFRANPDVIQPLINLGLTRDQGETLMRWWYKQHTLRRLYILGLTKKEIREACERGWPGTQLLASPDALYYQLVENPYLIETLPLEKIQSIAQRYNVRASQDTIECANLIRFVDKQTQENGWACYPIYGLMNQFPRYRQLEPVIKKEFECTVRYNFFYLRHQAQVEDRLVELLEPRPLKETHVSKFTRDKLCEEQIKAVEMALNNEVSVITGSAGSGKSTIIASIEHELELRGISYRIASFTGKAVSRIKELVRNLDLVATMHMLLNRALEYAPDGTVLCECLIVDEVSMIPNELFAKVLLKLSSAQPRGRRLKIVLVGDPKQIPPIEWGDLFNQVLESEKIPRIHLEEDHRRTTEGALYRNMRQFATVKDPKDIRFEWGKDCEHIPGTIPELIATAQSSNKDYSHTQITILSPFDRNLDHINQLCLQFFIPPDAPSMVDNFGKTWKKGARVMMTRNRYDIKVMNGEEGIVLGVNPGQFYIEVRFKQGQEVKIPTFVPVINEDLEEDDQPLSTKLLVLSWAVTIHKSQGSEWDVVLLYLPPDMGRSSFWNRKLLYTGASRAKTEFNVISLDKYTFEQAIYIDPPKRYDNLAKRLRREPFVDYYVDQAVDMYLK